MTTNAHAELLADVLSRYEQSPNPRLREINEAAIRHLHAFVEEVGLQRDEWFAGIQFLTAVGQKCDATRQEFILLSDTLGVSTLVEFVTHGGTAGSTENTVLGPFFVPGSPQRARGETMLVDPDDGDRVVIRGTVSDPDGQPIAGRHPGLLAERDGRLLRRAAARDPIRPRTSAASTPRTATGPTRSAPSGRCPTRSRTTVRSAICCGPTSGAGCAPATPTCG